ncbi:ATP-binding SpoIIE family protein phosphatase [Catenuloplanes japonicus]|uniref:ATP-binding SpoIIE family protein phosphatase n=1 Tax=Catenuloplanes japonicus TaxID=33876 RepID=UPI00052719D5|nr:SpoIIE family protein phosphatase [Catenuloplanes japonicus]
MAGAVVRTVSASPSAHVGGQAEETHVPLTAADLLASHPWQASPLGPPEAWDPALRATVDLIVGSPVAMSLAFGDAYTLIYNDAFAVILGREHPGSFGRPAAEVFGESWAMPGVGDVIDHVYRTGEPFREAETSVGLVLRSTAGEPDQAVFTRGCSAVKSSDGRTIGVLTVATETTEATSRLQSLSELTGALASALTLDDVARVALRYGLSAFDVDHVTIGVDDASAWRVVRRVRGELLDEADERLPPLWRRLPLDSPSPLAQAAVSGQAAFTEDGQPLRDVAADRHDQRQRAMAAIPLRTHSLRGALTFGRRHAHQWLPAERAQLDAAAELIGQAAERARRFETQHGTAQLLQRSMLPEHLPNLDRFRVAARYDPGIDGSAAGGDFYDAFVLPDGRLAIVLGDVAGHDMHAAALMGQVRAALRALALANPDPVVVLDGLDKLVGMLGTGTRSHELFVTVAYGLLDQRDGRLTLASAGHPAPLIRHASAEGQHATVGYLDVPTGTPLGLGGAHRTMTTALMPGDTILLFSDGVIERRRRELDDGLSALAKSVSEATSGDPRNLCALATSAVAGATEDDVAVLAVEYAVSPSRAATMNVPPEPTMPGRVRHWMTAQLTAWDVPEAVIGAAVLCTSELTTNALLHAGTAARVHIDLTPERLLVSVQDSGTRGTVTRAHTDTLSSRGRGLGLIEELSDAWGTDPTVRGSTVWFEILISEDHPE